MVGHALIDSSRQEPPRGARAMARKHSWRCASHPPGSSRSHVQRVGSVWWSGLQIRGWAVCRRTHARLALALPPAPSQRVKRRTFGTDKCRQYSTEGGVVVGCPFNLKPDQPLGRRHCLTLSEMPLDGGSIGRPLHPSWSVARYSGIRRLSTASSATRCSWRRTHASDLPFSV